MTDQKTDSERAAEFLDNTTHTLGDLAANDQLVAVASQQIARGPFWLRNTLYILGIALGAVATVIPVVVAFMTGDTKTLAVSVGGLVVLLNGLFAKLNITKPTPAVAAVTTSTAEQK